uniref:Uncharacterized protein n=1 Tax=Timema cristinae TaxID=61476 RepID=A0A7R9CNA9_TIMCR|nr:unnamed protein product [Timema cristinae]
MRQHYKDSKTQVTKEVAQVQAMGKPIPKESKYVDIYREKPIRVAVKVLVPIKEHPKGTRMSLGPTPLDTLMSSRRLGENTSPISRDSTSTPSFNTHTSNTVFSWWERTRPPLDKLHCFQNKRRGPFSSRTGVSEFHGTTDLVPS